MLALVGPVKIHLLKGAGLLYAAGQECHINSPEHSEKKRKAHRFGRPQTADCLIPAIQKLEMKKGNDQWFPLNADYARFRRGKYPVKTARKDQRAISYNQQQLVKL